MKRLFADLHIKINGKNHEQILKMAAKAAQLGYKLIGIQLSLETKSSEIQGIREACKTLGLDFASRVDLRPRSQNELLSLLRKLRRRFEVICVLCETKEIARQAAKDRRVDLLNFPLLDYRRRFFFSCETQIAASGCAALEIDIKPILVLEGPPRVRLISSLRREVQTALDFKLPIVLSSGVSEPLLLRKPREMALLSSIFDLYIENALKAVSENPFAIVKRNREKLDANFVAPGIRVINRGGDC
jgi:RNase P/RNase MRP subunit p30